MAFSIGGQLNFASGGNPFGGNPAASYASAYNSALNFNKQNYNNILQGFTDTMAAQQQQQAVIGQGYSQLEADVLGGIAGTSASAHQEIFDNYYKQRGSAQQQLINRGLGNTTVQSSVDRGLMYDRSKAEINLANQFAQMTAGYRSDLGKTRLNYLNSANMQNTQLANQQLQWMNSVDAPYPKAADYMQAAMMQGANRAGSPMPFLGGGGGAVSFDKKPLAPGGQMPINGYSTQAFGNGYGAARAGGYGGQASPWAIYPEANADTNWYENPETGNWESPSSGETWGGESWGEEGTDWSWLGDDPNYGGSYSEYVDTYGAYE